MGIIIQARNSSSRLPNKLLKNFHLENSLIDIVLIFLKKNFFNYKIVLATSKLQCDNIFSEYSNKHKVYLFKGSHENVLERFIDASTKYEFTHIIRVCSDNPFLISHYIKELIKSLNINRRKDYISFKMSNGLPVIKSHLGLFVEIVSVSSLLKTKELTSENKYLENVTQFIYENPDIFDVMLIDAPKIVNSFFDLRFTMDDEKDFLYLKKLYSTLYPELDNLKLLVSQIKDGSKIKRHMISNINKYSK